LKWASEFSKSSRLAAEVYYKKTRNKYYPIEEDLIVNDLDELFGEVATVESYGMELNFRIAKEKWQSTISYALSTSKLQVDELNFGAPFPFQFDRRHEIKSLNNVQISNNLTLGMSVYLGSGHPFLVTNEFDPETGLTPVDINEPGEKNLLRIQFQHRLDISLLYSRITEKVTHLLKLNLYNTYNNKLPLYYSSGEENAEEILTPHFSLPLLPSISYTIKI